MQQRVVRFYRFDLLPSPIAVLGIRAGVTQKSDHFQVEEYRSPIGPAVIDRRLGDTKGLRQIEAVCAKIRKTWPCTHCGVDPAWRSGDADPDAVVFTHEENWHREALMSRPACGVECGLGRGVVD